MTSGFLTRMPASQRRSCQTGQLGGALVLQEEQQRTKQVERTDGGTGNATKWEGRQTEEGQGEMGVRGRGDDSKEKDYMGVNTGQVLILKTAQNGSFHGRKELTLMDTSGSLVLCGLCTHCHCADH